MMMANMALQMAQQSPPGMFNLEELNRTILNAANMPNVDQILPPKIEPKPLDPVSDIMAATKGVPIAAFPGQNHDAHIQIKMAYLQDPLNGANPIMERIAPILQANIQEHSIMKYQEQMNGVTEQMMQGVNPEEAQNPAVVEMVMAQAAQQVLNANQAVGMAQSPEQQLVSLEQAKVELEKQKLQSDTMVQAAEMELKTKKLKLEEADQIIDLLKTNASNSMKEEKAELDRQAKERIKELDIEGKLNIEQFKVTVENEKEVAQTIKDMLEAKMQDDKEMEEKALEALTQLAVMQKEMTDDEQG
jgi:hypothetical protein